MASQDHYATLGISRTASDAEIKRAFRKLAKEHHPDATGKTDANAETRFKEISNAYETLSDPKKRQMYDQFGDAGANMGGEQGFNPGQYGGFDFGGFQGGDFGNIFETFFGGQGGQRRAQRGEDIGTELSLVFEDSVRGATKELAYERVAECATCKGSGAAAGSKRVKCDTCEGSGQVRRQQRTILGSIVTARPCPTCAGEGTVPEQRCATCAGSGTKRTTERLKVRIPAGIADGDTMRIPGKGNAATGVPSGDLYIRMQVRPSREFQREGMDIHSSRTITVPQAALGAEVDVQTVQGPVVLKIPAGTQSGTVLRLKGKGIAPEGREPGNHLVTVVVEIPKKLSKEEKKLYEALRGR